MTILVDHVVLWVDDPLRAVDFYEQILGFEGVRVAEFRQGKAPFPSVRVSSDTVFDLMARSAAALVSVVTGSEGSAGHPVNHVCLAMSEPEFETLRVRLQSNGIAMSTMLEQSFGARGLAPRAFYFRDPDGNVLEARYYEPASGVVR